MLRNPNNHEDSVPAIAEQFKNQIIDDITQCGQLIFFLSHVTGALRKTLVMLPKITTVFSAKHEIGLLNVVIGLRLSVSASSNQHTDFGYAPIKDTELIKGTTLVLYWHTLRQLQITRLFFSFNYDCVLCAIN
jgi:hypothetical protein